MKNVLHFSSILYRLPEEHAGSFFFFSFVAFTHIHFERRFSSVYLWRSLMNSTQLNHIFTLSEFIIVEQKQLAGDDEFNEIVGFQPILVDELNSNEIVWCAQSRGRTYCLFFIYFFKIWIKRKKFKIPIFFPIVINLFIFGIQMSRTII